LGTYGPNRRGGLDPVQSGEAVVDEDDVRVDARANVQRRLAVRNRRDDAHVRSHVEEELQSRAKDVVVLDEDDVDRLFAGHSPSIGHSTAKRSG
jgi:hypothetical protein